MTTSKYAAAHVSPEGPGDARPTALQIVEDEGLENKLTNKTFLITGCSSGIGLETARAIAATGATVFCTVRDLERGKIALADILESPNVELLYMDLNSLDSVRTAAEEFLSKTEHKPINVLICNAGVLAIPAPGTATEDGFETQFGTNHLAHFLLFNLVKQSLLISSTPQFNSRVVMVSSDVHRMNGVRFDDYNFHKEGEYTPLGAYAQSKTANIYMANIIERHYGAEGIHANSVHPGVIWTPLQKYLPEETLEAWKSVPENRRILKSTAQGAATTVWAAVGREWEGKGGKYLENVEVALPVREGYKHFEAGYEKWAYDEQMEDRLWADSLKMGCANRCSMFTSTLGNSVSDFAHRENHME
ncbi:unnamed protein product [Calypogeia fissa]